MSNRFPDSWKRYRRAIHHAKAFTDEWNALFKPEATTALIERKDQETWVARSILHPMPDNNLALELGEFTYQLMAALDGVVFEATMLQGETDTPANVESLYFPIAKKLRTFNESTFNHGPLPQDLKHWVESVQPYNAGKAVDPEMNPLISSLITLHNCAQKDRHRRLNLLAAPPTSIQYSFDLEGPGEVVDIKILEADFLIGKCEFLQFGVKGFVEGRTTSIKLHTGVTVELRVEEIPIAMGSDLTSELKRILDAVDYALRVFEARFE